MRTLFSEGHYLEALDLFHGDEKSGFTLNKIGKMFHFGVGVTQDFNKARSLYEASLECQYFPTAHHLGRLYLNGEGVSRDV
ncbi:hypothetical protein OAN22_00865 [Alphaproteobacteria bacterium]|nr:hypothetical protein [Alphaproteobacteria bacterium]